MWPLQSRLSTGIWHTTHPERLAAILEQGLMPEPDLPDSERWKTAHGPEFHSFVRALGGVSLFDFSSFEPDAYSKACPLSSWATFVPHRTNWGGAAWIEIDHKALGDRFVDADELLRRWKDGEHYRHTIMPRIECAGIGSIPVSAFRSAFVTWAQGAETREVVIETGGTLAGNAAVDAWRASTPLVDAEEYSLIRALRRGARPSISD